MMLRIVWLYARDMNIYGDYGNILAVKKRLELRGIVPEIIEYNPGDEFPMDADIILGGGGQDSGQSKIQQDLLEIAPKLKELAEKNVPMIVICGLYQLFGEYFETKDGEKIMGVSIFKGLTTVGGDVRMIGNISEKSDEFGEIVGYENHSGQTFLSENNMPLAEVLMGAGNNPEAKFEGARYKNTIGTYLHGSVLPKNPGLTDFLIKKAFENQGEKMPDIAERNREKTEFLERITEKAREIAISRPR